MGGLPRKCASIGGSGNPHICTPDWILEAVRYYADGPIYLDPFGNRHSIVHAAVEYWGPRSADPRHRVNSLSVRWFVKKHLLRAKRAVAYANCPYTRGLVDQCVEKMAEEGRSRVIEVIGLLPARTSASWFQWCFPPTADALCFLNRRVRFIGSQSAPAWESVLPYWGPTPARFRDAMHEAGVAAKVFLR